VASDDEKRDEETPEAEKPESSDIPPHPEGQAPSAPEPYPRPEDDAIPPPPPPGPGDSGPQAPLPPGSDGGMPPMGSAPSERPGMVLAIHIMTLAAGILMAIMAATVAVSTCLIWIPWVLGLSVGIWAIVEGAQMLNNPETRPPNKNLYILMIVCILNCDIVAMTVGILCLVFMGFDDVKNWYASKGIHY